MTPRTRARLRVSGLLLGCLFVLLSVGTAAAARSGHLTTATASGAKISAHLTKTRFTSSQAGKVKLIYKFSKPSKSFGYLLTFKKGAKWLTVKSVKKKGYFKGSHTMTVKKVFAGKAVKVGSYRLKLSADGGSKLLSFKVVTDLPGAFNKTSPANGATEQLTSATLSWGSSSNAASYEYCVDTSNDNACAGAWVSVGASSSASPSGLTPSTTYYWQVRAENASGQTYSNGGAWWSFTTWKPTAGSWTTSSGVSFTVSSDQTTIEPFTGLFRPGSGYLVLFGHNTPIVNGQFSQTSAFYYSGTFDSPTTAHGAVGLNNYCTGPSSCYTGGPYTWTATWASP
jgi:hypothetical protein